MDSIEARSNSNIDTFAAGIRREILDRASLPLTELRLVIMTSKPLEARARAVSKPRPVLAPVTIANDISSRLEQE
jgi:hypothetical protein